LEAFVIIIMVTMLTLNASVLETKAIMASFNSLHNKLEERISDRTAELQHEGTLQIPCSILLKIPLQFLIRWEICNCKQENRGAVQDASQPDDWPKGD
jgi:hypothetical protein